jgi:hypothetical protein
VDGSVRVEGHDRAGVERLVRYCAQGPLALERLHAIDGQAALASPQARLLYRLAEPDLQGRTELVLSPFDLLERLARLVPPRPLAEASGARRHRYHGVLAPHARLRPLVVAIGSEEVPSERATEPSPTNDPQPYRGRRRLQPLPNRRAPRAPPASAGLSSSPASTRCCRSCARPAEGR